MKCFEKKFQSALIWSQIKRTLKILFKVRNFFKVRSYRGSFSQILQLVFLYFLSRNIVELSLVRNYLLELGKIVCEDERSVRHINTIDIWRRYISKWLQQTMNKIPHSFTCVIEYWSLYYDHHIHLKLLQSSFIV